MRLSALQGQRYGGCYQKDVYKRQALLWVSGGAHTGNIEFTAAEQAAGNPFWDENSGKVDFAKYAQRMGVPSIDYIYVLLGWNSAGETETSYKAEVRTFIGNMLSLIHI